MILSSKILCLASLHLSRVAADHLVPTYPAPVDLSSNQSLVSIGWQNLTSTFDEYLRGTNRTGKEPLTGVENVTFSIGMFSLHDPDALKLQYHYASPETAQAENGAKTVDDNSIYRIASVSKLITVFAGMLLLSENHWNRPLTHIAGDFSDQLHGHSASDPIWKIQWDKVTPWSLATQLSGIPTLGLPAFDRYNPLLLKTYGAPAVDVAALGTCASNFLQNSSDYDCSASDSAAAIDNLPPNFLPWSTPVYSDLGYMLLGVAISNITGKSISAMYNDSIFAPLGMTSSSDTHPTSEAEVKRSVIVGDPAAGLSIDIPITTPSGGLFSTISDLQKLGIGILNSSLLCPEATRKWMKPVTHTSSFSYSIGAPWEIHRYINPTTGKLTELYTKLGDAGYYGGVEVLIPQYDAGFTMLNAGTSNSRSPGALVILDYVTETILPALEAQALVEAKRNFVGTYQSTDPNLNASITIGFDQATAIDVKSDLIVVEWNYNGTNVLAGPFFESNHPRLEQSIPNQAPTWSAGKVAFQLSNSIQTLTYMDAMKMSKTGVIGTWTGFYNSNGDFVYTDQLRWGGVGVNMFVFDVDEQGRATTCTPAFDRIKLKRV